MRSTRSSRSSSARRRPQPSPSGPLPLVPGLARGHSPEAYAFELVRGSLVCNVKGHKKSAPELDDLLCRLGRRRPAAAGGGDRVQRARCLRDPLRIQNGRVVARASLPPSRRRRREAARPSTRRWPRPAPRPRRRGRPRRRAACRRRRSSRRGRVGRGSARRAVERLAADVDPLVGVGAVAAEGEEAVEVGAGELDVRRGLGVAGDQADKRPSPVSRRSSSTPASPGSRASFQPHATR